MQPPDTRILNMGEEQTSTLSAAVQHAATSAYEVFARYSPPQGGTYSAHAGISADDVRALRSRSLRELSGRDLSKYSMKALTTWGDENEFRHYLPRLLELVVLESGWTDVPTLFEKLTTGTWRAWPEPEQRAVENLVEAIWRDTLEGRGKAQLADLALGASIAGIPLAPLLRVWSATPGTPAVVQLAHLISLERDDLLGHGTTGRDLSTEAQTSITALLVADETSRRFESVLFELGDGDNAALVSSAIGILETLAQTRHS